MLFTADFIKTYTFGYQIVTCTKLQWMYEWGLTINIEIVICTCNHINTPTRVIGGQHYTTLSDPLTRLNRRNQNFSGHL